MIDFVALGMMTLQTIPLHVNNLPTIETNIEKDIYDFCDEQVPMHNFEVRERLDRELVVNTNLHSATTLIIKRAHKVFPIIEPILKKNNIPDDFKYLCVIESALTNATSSAGAKGYWQFMANTAREYNLEISDTIDERNHLVNLLKPLVNF